ncbi:MAG: MYG1 family protein [Oscillospiraceae bacterium]|nr:MYG1 family protein [Oscillospiraceae bacterium]
MKFIYKKACTHSGRFHADDVFSTALVRYLNPNIQIIRVNDVPDDFDGLVYDIGRGKYDHHMPECEVRPNGIKYAAFGLLWRDFGAGIIGREKALGFDERFVAPLDLSDNTGEYNQVAEIISAFNPQWNSVKSQDEAFNEATDFALRILIKIFGKYKSVEAAKKIVHEAYSSSDKTTVKLEKYVPWKDVLENSPAKFVMFPSQRGGYAVVGVPAVNEQHPKVMFPESWAGLCDEELEQVSGIRGMKFCHVGRHMISASDMQACETAIQKTLEQSEIEK